MAVGVVLLISMVSLCNFGISAQVHVPSPYMYPSFWIEIQDDLQFLVVLTLCFAPLVLLDVLYLSQ